jgi:hypothetical protein
MKAVVIASLLGTLAGGLVLPRIGGPVHYQITRAHALYAEIPAAPPGGPSVQSVSFGTLPVDFVLQDLVLGGAPSWPALNAAVKVNGTRVFGAAAANWQVGIYSILGSTSTHLSGGVFIPAGSTIEVEAATSDVTPVTLSGYVQ